MDFDTTVSDLARILRDRETGALELLAAAVYGHHLEQFGYPEYRAEDIARALAQTWELSPALVNAGLQLISRSLDPSRASTDDLLLLASILELARIPDKFSERPHAQLLAWISAVRTADLALVEEVTDLRGRTPAEVRSSLGATLERIAKNMQKAQPEPGTFHQRAARGARKQVERVQKAFPESRKTQTKRAVHG